MDDDAKRQFMLSVLRELEITVGDQKEKDATMMADYITRYPAITAELEALRDRRFARFDARLAWIRAYDLGQPLPAEQSASPDDDVLKAEQWELLTLLSSVDPDLPITTIYDGYCAKLDGARKAIRLATTETVDKMLDVAAEYDARKPKPPNS